MALSVMDEDEAIHYWAMVALGMIEDEDEE